MLLTISTTHRPAVDLGYLLHKNPARPQSFDLSFGRAHVFYPEASDEHCAACLLLDVDSVGIVRGNQQFADGTLAQYVNDRPYVASSFLSVAIARVFGSALQGHSKERAELAATEIPLSARLDVLPVRGGLGLVGRLFEPLGYTVTTQRHVLDEKFPEWGEGPFYSVTLDKVTTLSALLTHLYVLVPVFDNAKHYFIGEAELEKLLAHGSGWLALHPEREFITRRYLRSKPNLVRQALARLLEGLPEEPDEAETEARNPEIAVEKPLRLHDERLRAVAAAIVDSGAKRVLDLGCGDGKLLHLLWKERQLEQIVGLDVSVRSLEIANRRLRLERLATLRPGRCQLLHGSLTYRDERLSGFDAAAIVEVVEHLDPPRLAAFERVVFEFARPQTVVLTTPNREYNVVWESLPAGAFRHPDHRFEWNREEFAAWAARIAERFAYRVTISPLGPEYAEFGSPTQMAVFQRD
jgi:3' terminal RNA ribose 2'-O-methyltransferase Hen1